jgi:hypothetical protein
MRTKFHSTKESKILPKNFKNWANKITKLNEIGQNFHLIAFNTVKFCLIPHNAVKDQKILLNSAEMSAKFHNLFPQFEWLLGKGAF